MKKIIFVLATLLVTSGLFAQTNDQSNFRLGAGLISYSGNVGINLKGVFTINQEWDAGLGYTNVFTNNDLSYNIIDFDAYYNLNKDQSLFDVYCFGGLGLGLLSLNNNSETELGFNLGVGAAYHISTKLDLVPEMRFTLQDDSYSRIGVTLQYKF